MESTNYKEQIESIITMTFEAICRVYKTNREKSNSLSKEDSRIVFPLKRSKEIRVSEQELRFVFVEQFNKYCTNAKNNCNLFYSIETPTQKEYNFSNPNSKNQRSGCIDLVIFNSEGERICLIEFKANNPPIDNYKKDFAKLDKEDVELGYFIQIVENSETTTVLNIENKIDDFKKQAIYYCYCLKRGELILNK